VKVTFQIKTYKYKNLMSIKRTDIIQWICIENRHYSMDILKTMKTSLINLIITMI